MRDHSSAAEPPSLGEFNGFEVYPMPVFATLRVHAIGEVATWYEKTLDFRPMFTTADPDGHPMLIHLRRRKYQDLLLVPAASDAQAGPTTLTLSFSADEDIDALAERARSIPRVGRSKVEGPLDTPWNTRDVRVTDPAGHAIVLTSRRADSNPGSWASWQARFNSGTAGMR
jgi:uncharacterized glyoxalase superfamily protein PhnB